VNDSHTNARPPYVIAAGEVLDAIDDSVVNQLAAAAREHSVMVSITFTPYDADETTEDAS
jgi:hypothetical protein